MADIKQQVTAMMRRIRKGRLPSSDQIVEEAFEELGYLPGQVPRGQARREFNNILQRVWERTLVVLERYEHEAYAAGIPRELSVLCAEDVRQAETLLRRAAFSHAVSWLFERWYLYLRQSFLSVSQSRKTRGGRDFELQFGRMLDLAGIPYQKLGRAYRVDFMIPNDVAFRGNPTSAVVASAKRTLRERWQEVVAELEALRCPNTFLVTADENISQGKVRDISRHRIHLVVWDEVKARQHPGEPLVLSYTEWINDRMPALEQFWAPPPGA